MGNKLYYGLGKEYHYNKKVKKKWKLSCKIQGSFHMSLRNNLRRCWGITKLSKKFDFLFNNLSALQRYFLQMNTAPYILSAELRHHYQDNHNNRI